MSEDKRVSVNFDLSGAVMWGFILIICLLCLGPCEDTRKTIGAGAAQIMTAYNKALGATP